MMRSMDFLIDDVKCENGRELVATKKIDSDELWWRDISVEGSGFNQLFKGAIRNLGIKGDI